MSIKCGNHKGLDIRHETVADVKACYASPNGVADFAPTTEGVRYPIAPEAPAETLAEINRDQETWPWTHRKNKDQHPFDLGRRYHEAAAEMGVEVTPWDEPLMPKGSARQAPQEQESVWAEFEEPKPQPEPQRRGGATEPMRAFLRILLAERDWERRINPESQNGETISDLGNDAWISFSAAKLLIETLKGFPKHGHDDAPKAEKAPKEQPWRTLSKEVPAGNYCIEDAEGKNHFYRVSVGRNSFYKLQERASEELHFIPLNRYEGILRAILEAGIEAARLRYSTTLKRCWHCHLALTDNTGNPHYGRGLGPKCGEEH